MIEGIQAIDREWWYLDVSRQKQKVGKMRNLPKIDFQSLFESLPGLYLILLPDLTIVEVSDSYADATMTKRQEIIGRALFEVFPDNPDDYTADGVSNLRASLNKVLKSKSPHTMAVQRYDIRKRDGSFEVRYWSPLNKPVLNEKREVLYIIHRVEDVTEFVRVKELQIQKDQITDSLQGRIKQMEIEVFKRSREIQEMNEVLEQKMQEIKESKEKFFKVFHSSPAGITIGDETGKWIDTNEHFSIMTGYEREEVIGQTSSGLNLIETQERARLVEMLNKEGKLKDFEVTYKHKSGETKMALFSSEKTMVNGKKYLITILHDITDRKKTEEKIQRMNAELEQKVVERTNHLMEANKSIQKNVKQLSSQNAILEQFVYIASHDLQEPLRTVSSFVGLLEEQFKGQLNPDADKYLEYISEASERMKALVKGLLDYSRIGVKRERSYVDCTILIKNILDDLGSAVKESEAVIDIGPLPIISAYEMEIRLLFQNLLSNAIKFRKKGTTPHITITTEKKPDKWLFKIQDNGVGFDMQFADKIFTIFQRLHLRSEYSGTGIGLAHCKKIVELHEGEIWAESVPNEGSTFYFTIPTSYINK